MTAPRGRFNYGKFMKWIRRIHLYAGLFLVPWVILYGVSGYLFNHPEAFSSTERLIVPTDEVIAAGFPSLPNADELAGSVVAALNRPTQEDSRRRNEVSVQNAAARRHPANPTTFRLATEPAANVTGRIFLSTGSREPGRTSLSLEIDPVARSGRLSSRKTPARPNPEQPRFRTRRNLAAGQDYLQSARAAGTKILAADGESAVRLRAAPRVAFNLVEVQPNGKERTWRASYRLDRKELRAEAIGGDAPPTDWRRFLLRLHTAHRYPTSYGARWVWALMVDIMAIAMVLWALSGVMMWWQMRNLRRIGLVVLILCALVAVPLTLGMHTALF